MGENSAPSLAPWASTVRDQFDADALATLLERTTEALVLLGLDGAIRFANPAARALLDEPAGALLGTTALGFVHPADRPRATAAVRDALEAGESSAELRVRRRGATWRRLDVMARHLHGTPGVDGILLGLRDVTDRVDAERALRISERRFRELADRSPDLTFLCSAGTEPTFHYVSPALHPITGYHPSELLGDPGLIQRILDPMTLGALRDPEADGPTHQPAVRVLHHRDGSDVWVEVRLGVHRDLDGRDALIEGTISDLTEQKRTEEDLLHRALHDHLTGLPNRALFHDRLEHAMALAERQSSHPAVLFLDLDHFKAVNDRFGHAGGDVVLVAVAQRLTAAVRGSDTVARLGGDEFLVLCDDVGDDGELQRIVDRVRHAVARPVSLRDGEPTVGISIGAARADVGSQADALLRIADDAMYRDKAAGRQATRPKPFLTRDPSLAGQRRRNDHP